MRKNLLSLLLVALLVVVPMTTQAALVDQLNNQDIYPAKIVRVLAPDQYILDVDFNRTNFRQGRTFIREYGLYGVDVPDTDSFRETLMPQVSRVMIPGNHVMIWVDRNNPRDVIVLPATLNRSNVYVFNRAPYQNDAEVPINIWMLKQGFSRFRAMTYASDALRQYFEQAEADARSAAANSGHIIGGWGLYWHYDVHIPTRNLDTVGVMYGQPYVWLQGRGQEFTANDVGRRISITAGASGQLPKVQSFVILEVVNGSLVKIDGNWNWYTCGTNLNYDRLNNGSTPSQVLAPNQRELGTATAQVGPRLRANTSPEDITAVPQTSTPAPLTDPPSR